MDGEKRENIKIGMIVDIVLKADQKTGKLTRGIVADILTSSALHHRGIKVRLKDGQVGRLGLAPRESNLIDCKSVGVGK